MTVTLDGPPEGLQIPENRHLDAPIGDVEFRDDGDRLVFQGHAAVFDRKSEDLGGFREVIQRGAFRKVLDGNPDVRFLINHAGLPLARTTNGTLELREDPRGLRVYAELAPTQEAKDLRILIKRGDVNQMSFGFRLDPSAGGKDVWTEQDGDLVRTIVSFSGLFDVSPVTYPAYQQTDASMRALVCGIEVVTAGAVDVDRLRDLAWKIHRGEQEATVEERSALDAVFSRTETVSPWTAERAARAFCEEPELRAVVQGKRVTVTVDEDPETSGLPAFRLAARQRRLNTLA